MNIDAIWNQAMQSHKRAETEKAEAKRQADALKEQEEKERHDRREREILQHFTTAKAVVKELLEENGQNDEFRLYIKTLFEQRSSRRYLHNYFGRKNEVELILTLVREKGQGLSVCLHGQVLEISLIMIEGTAVSTAELKILHCKHDWQSGNDEYHTLSEPYLYYEKDGYLDEVLNRLTTPETAIETIVKQYGEVKESVGFVPNKIKVLLTNPASS